MQQKSMSLQRRVPCPTEVCECGHRGLLESDSHGINHPVVFFTKMTEYKTLERIRDIDTVQAFDGLRNEILKRFRIVFSVQGNGSVSIPEIPGLCRKTRGNLLAALESRFRSEPELLRSVLDRFHTDEDE